MEGDSDGFRPYLGVRGTAPAPEVCLERAPDKHVQGGRRHARPLAVRPRGSPRVLRHTCALTVLQATKDLRRASLWLEHAHIQTTEMYARSGPSVKVDAFEAMIAPKAAIRPVQGHRQTDRLADGTRRCGGQMRTDDVPTGSLTKRPRITHDSASNRPVDDLGEAARRHRARHGPARSAPAPRTRAEVRTAQLAHERRFAPPRGGEVTLAERTRGRCRAGRGTCTASTTLQADPIVAGQHGSPATLRWKTLARFAQPSTGHGPLKGTQTTGEPHRELHVGIALTWG
jgi:hypothetical protein